MNRPRTTRREGKPRKLEIHKDALVYDDVEIDMSGKVTIEEYATLYHGVKVLTHKHHWPTKARRLQNETIERVDLRVGRDAFIGQDAMLLTVKNIGEGAVIGARSVVTKDVPPFEIWAGNPACKIGERKDVERTEDTK